MKKSSFQKLEEKVRSGEVRIIGVISPPRVVSTAVEILLVESPDIDGQVNEPFHISMDSPEHAREDAEERAYADVLRRVEEIKECTGKSRITIVMKEMAKNIAPGAQMQRWIGLTDKQLILMRNPLSNLESLIRKVSQSAEHLRDVLDFDLDGYAYARGHRDEKGEGLHWRAMVDYAVRTQDYQELDEALESFFPVTNLYRLNEDMGRAYVEVADNAVARRAGYESLDDFAVLRGFESWQHMRTEQTELSNYAPILEAMFAFRNAGWESLVEHMEHMEKIPVVLDTTVLRADPENVLAVLCEDLEITFSPSMVSGWTLGNEGNFDRGHRKHGGSPFIDKAVHSTGLNLPKERPISLDQFPERFRGYLLDIALPAYMEMLSNPGFIGPLDEKEILDMLEKEVEEGVPLVQRDPVFAYALVGASEMDVGDKANLLRKIRIEEGAFYRPVLDALDVYIEERRRRFLTSHAIDTSTDANVHLFI